MPKEGFKYRDRSTETFCGLGVIHPKHGGNIGTLFRTAAALDCVDFLFTVGEKYTAPHSDTVCSAKRKPCFHFSSFQDFEDHIPLHCNVVGVELHKTSVPLETFNHPSRALYLLGSESDGLPWQYLERCNYKVEMPSPLGISMNLAAAGSILLWDRILKCQ